MRVAVLVKQIPQFEAMELGPDGRLVREGLAMEMNPYCRRAVSQGVALARETGGTCTVFTLGPPMAEDVLREAIAWGADDGVLITDPAFAGSDTIATAKALAAALAGLAVAPLAPFDLVLTGRNSVDADTGQVGPQLAELLERPFATGVKRLSLGDGELVVLCEEDDGRSERRVRLPAVVSCAERLIEPAKVDPAGRAAVAAERIRRLCAADLGAGPWGQDGSSTYVGEVRVLDVARDRVVLAGPVASQVEEAIALLHHRGALTPRSDTKDGGQDTPILLSERGGGPAVAVMVEPDRPGLTRELLGAAARLARDIDGHVAAIGPAPLDVEGLATFGADRIVAIEGAAVEEDVAVGVSAWCERSRPWAVLAPSTTWGREVAGRVAARLDAGLTGDAIELEATRVASTGEAQLLAWKPAFGGRLVAAVYASTPIQMATVRAGVVRPASPRRLADELPRVERLAVEPRGRVTIDRSVRDDDLDVIASAPRVVTVGAGVDPTEYAIIDELLDVLGAELAATRKVTDKAWLPRSRQVGITGRSIAPQLAVVVGASGKFNHMVGLRAAGTVLAVNPDPDAPIWDHADIGIVADWHDAVPLLVDGLRQDAAQ